MPTSYAAIAFGIMQSMVVFRRLEFFYFIRIGTRSHRGAILLARCLAFALVCVLGENAGAYRQAQNSGGRVLDVGAGHVRHQHSRGPCHHGATAVGPRQRRRQQGAARYRPSRLQRAADARRISWRLVANLTRLPAGFCPLRGSGRFCRASDRLPRRASVRPWHQTQKRAFWLSASGRFVGYSGYRWTDR